MMVNLDGPNILASKYGSAHVEAQRLVANQAMQRIAPIFCPHIIRWDTSPKEAGCTFVRRYSSLHRNVTNQGIHIRKKRRFVIHRDLGCVFKENDANYIDDKVALCLYLGIVTDTGGFTFNNTTSETLKIASELLKYGVDGHKVVYKTIKERTPQAFALRARTLSNAQFLLDGRVGIITFLKDDYIQTGTTSRDTEGIINDVIDVDGVKLAISVAEMEDLPAFKVGIRSKDGVDAGKYAALFGGGGHHNASGCRIYANLSETMDRLIRAAKQILDGEDA